MMPTTWREATRRSALRFTRHAAYLSPTQDYGFEYSDEDEAGESGSADVENMYYKAKGVSFL